MMVDSALHVSDALVREYPIATVTWAATSAQNDLLSTINFPDALFAKSYIADKLRGFQHFRAGVEVSFRVNGNQYLYGLLMASWDPATSLDASANEESNIWTSSGFPHVLISANDAVVPTLRIPWVFPHPALDLATFASGSIGSLQLSVVAPLQSMSSSTPPTLVVTVYAKFVDPRVFTPTTGVTLATPTPATVSTFAVSSTY
jgi:hypothetical protein